MRFVTSRVRLRIQRICLHLPTSPKTSSPVTTTAMSSLLLMWSVLTLCLCLKANIRFIVPISSHCILTRLPFTLLSEPGVWNHPDTRPGLRGGLPAGPAGQEEWPRIVHTAWELRQQAQQTCPQTSRQHPQICKHPCSTAALLLEGKIHPKLKITSATQVVFDGLNLGEEKLLCLLKGNPSSLQSVW